MLFLEDLYASKRPAGPDWRSSRGRQPRPPRREPPPPPPPPEPNNAGETSSVSTERHDRASSVKRNSLFSRRKSTATNSSSESQKRNSGALSAGAPSRRSSLAEMAAVDGETLKSKLMFGFHSGKKRGPRKSDPTAAEEGNTNEKNGNRQGHHRGSSADCKWAINA